MFLVAYLSLNACVVISTMADVASIDNTDSAYTRSNLFASLPTHLRELEPEALTLMPDVELFKITPRRVRAFNRFFEINSVTPSLTASYDLLQDSLMVIRVRESVESFILDLKHSVGLKFKGVAILFDPTNKSLGWVADPTGGSELRVHFWYADADHPVEVEPESDAERTKFLIDWSPMGGTGQQSRGHFVSVTQARANQLVIEWGYPVQQKAAAISLIAASTSLSMPVLYMLFHRFVSGHELKLTELATILVTAKLVYSFAILLHQYFKNGPR